MKVLDDFEFAYAECALWSSLDEHGIPLDHNHLVEDIAPETLDQMIEDCRHFREDARADLAAASVLGLDDAKAGHDFWLTRNHHGSGFWDEDLGPVGKALTEKAHAYGSEDLWSDDGKVRGLS